MSEGKHHHTHLQDFKVYFGILIALLILTVFTVWIATLNFGKWNDVIAIAVAGTKASLVVLFFMHGRFESKLIWAFIYYPLIILGTLLAALFLDYGNRDHNTFVVGNVKVAPIEHGDGHGDTTHDAGGDHNQVSETATTQADHSTAPENHSADMAITESTDQSGESAGDGTTESTDSAGETAAASVGWGTLPGDAVAGKTHASSICIACHIIDGAGNALPGAPPFEESANLERINPEYLRKWFKDPNAVKPGTLMPNFALSDEQIENLIAYLATYKK